MSDDLRVHGNSGNVFEDMGMPDAAEHLAKAELARVVRREIRERGLTQAQAAEILGVKHPDGELATARAVFVVRPVLWGLAVGGEEGVARVLTALRDEFDLAMALAGCASVGDITRDLVERAERDRAAS